MPKIINAFADGSASLADSLKTLGDSMFGDQSKNAVLRETAKGKARENDAADQVAKFYADGDYRNAGAQSLRANPGATNMGAIGLAGTALDAGSNYRDPRLATMALGAGHSAEGTFPGLDATLAQRARAASEATNRAAATQLAIAEREQRGRDDQFARTPEQVVGPDGRIVLQPRSQAMGMPAGRNVELAAQHTRDLAVADRQAAQRQWEDEHTLVDLTAPDGATTIKVPKNQVGTYQSRGYSVAQSLDQTKANFLRPQAGTPGQSGSAPIAAPGIPQTATLDPDRRSMLGLPVTPQSFQDPATGRVGVSQNNGQSITLADGSVVPVAGSGFQPVSHEAALAQTQDNRAIQPLAFRSPAAPTQYSQAALDAEKTSGIFAPVQHELNTSLGLLPGGGEVNADVNRARENLTNIASFAREVLMSTPGHASVQAQEWANDSIPQPGWFGTTGANAETQKNRTVSFTTHMRNLYSLEAAEAQDRNTAPDQRRLLLTHMGKLKRAIELYEAPPAAPADGAPGRPAQATQSGAPAEAEMRRRGLSKGTPAQAAQGPTLEERVAEARRRGLMP